MLFGKSRVGFSYVTVCHAALRFALLSFFNTHDLEREREREGGREREGEREGERERLEYAKVVNLLCYS